MNYTVERGFSTVELNKVFSNTLFREILENGISIKLDSYLEKVKKTFDFKKEVSRIELLKSVYDYLLTDHRNEFVYKNFITNKILLGRHSINTTTLLNEFKVGNSQADCVLFNGKATVYEIKSELDSPDRLSLQINDYKKAFRFIYVVVHYSEIEKYLSIIKNTKVGLIGLNRRYQLSEVKESKPDSSSLDVETMFKCLRKNEYSEIIKDTKGYLPKVGNMFFYKECLKIANELDPIFFQKKMVEKLKERKPRDKNLYTNSDIPEFLTNICLALDLNNKEYLSLLEYLNKKI